MWNEWTGVGLNLHSQAQPLTQMSAKPVSLRFSAFFCILNLLHLLLLIVIPVIGGLDIGGLLPLELWLGFELRHVKHVLAFRSLALLLSLEVEPSLLFKGLRLLLASRACFWPALETFPLPLVGIRCTWLTEGAVARHRHVDIRLARSQSDGTSWNRYEPCN